MAAWAVIGRVTIRAGDEAESKAAAVASRVHGLSSQCFPWTGLPVIEKAVRHMLIPFIVLAVGILSPPPDKSRTHVTHHHAGYALMRLERHETQVPCSFALTWPGFVPHHQAN